MSDKDKQEYKKEILSEVMIRVNHWCEYGRGIDRVIIEDICDEIRCDKNI